jgi:hypothetical protein
LWGSNEFGGTWKKPDPKITFFIEEQQEDLTSNNGGVQIKSRCLNAKSGNAD